MSKPISVILKICTPAIEEEVKKIVFLLDNFCLKPRGEMGPCDLLILEIGKNPEKEVHLLHSIQDSGWARQVFLISSRMDPELIVQCRRAGAKKVFVLPFKKQELCEALLQIQEGEYEPPPGKRNQKSGKIIYVIGGKGGVGTTTVALYLASSLAQLSPSRSVLLTDLTPPFGDIPILLKTKPSPDWGQLLRNISRISSDLLKSILFQHPSGFFLLPSPSTSGNAGNPESVEKLMRFLQEGLDIIVVDGGKSFMDPSLKVLKMAEAVLLVTGANAPCIANLKRLFPIFPKIGPVEEKKLKIIVNRHQKNSPDLIEELERELDRKIFWKIPNDFRTVTEALNQAKTLAEIPGGREISKSFANLAGFFLTGGK